MHATKFGKGKIKFHHLAEDGWKYPVELYCEDIRSARVMRDRIRITVRGSEPRDVALSEPVPSKRDRQFQFLGSIIPSYSTSPKNNGRGRTAYFYRKEALNWFRNYRQGLFSIFGKDGQDTSLYFAKMYLQSYRKIMDEREAAR